MEYLARADRRPEPADPANFQGRATLTRFVPADTGAPGRVYRVAFEAGARTNWHTHSDTQILCVVEGRCRVQSWGGPVRVAETGDVVRFAAGEKHWHGSTGDAPMTHLAVNLGTRTDWLEPVED